MTALRIFLRQFRNGFFYILIAAAFISFFLNERIDTLVITTILLVNALLGFIQEWRSQRLLGKLEALLGQFVKVKKDTQIKIIPLKQLKVGEVVVLESGDRIPADLIVTEAQLLQTDESAITGESLPVDHRVGDKLLMGTLVLDGTAQATVAALGEQTEFGKIRSRATQVSSQSQFEQDMNLFSKKLMVLVLLTLAILFIGHAMLSRNGLDIPTLLLFILALAIGIVPEAMPLVTTLAMTSGALALARQKVVIKKLSAVEDLGNLVVLCTDKTGTVTEGTMSVAEKLVLDQQWFNRANLIALGKAGLANPTKHGPFDRAIWQDLPADVQRSAPADISVLWEDPFDPQTRLTHVVASTPSGAWMVTRGAPESVLEVASGHPTVTSWCTKQGLLGRRVLVIAGKPIKKQAAYSRGDARDEQVLGAIAFSDSLKNSAVKAVTDARLLGVQIRLITGDSAEVAYTTGKALGLVGFRKEVMTGTMLQQLPLEQQAKAILTTNVFARIFPAQKQEIVRILGAIGPVGFLGDGVNDAPALKAATVGIAADHATDVAREAASIILLKKDLHVIVDGIRKGRSIFANIETYLVFTLVGDFGTFYSIAAISLITPFLPMLPVQILLSNLLSDVPMVAIAADRVDSERLRKPAKSQFNRVIAFSLVMGLVSSLFDFALFGIFRHASAGQLQTLWFIFSVTTELVLIFSIRSREWFWQATRPAPLLVVGAIAAGAVTVLIPMTAWGKTLFHFVLPTAANWTTLGVLTVVYFATTETAKRFFSRLAPV